MKKKGQAVIIDLFVSVSVFIILMIILTITWDLYSVRLSNRMEYDDMILKTFLISDLLTKQEGVPFDWELQENPTYLTIDQIGLAERRGILSDIKVEKFRTLPNDDVSKMLNIGLYKHYFSIRDLNGTVYVSRNSEPSGRLAVNSARVVVYKGGPRVMEFALWKE